MKKINSFSVKSASETTTINESVNHIFVIDCSGSMTYDLPKMRMQMKNKIPSLIGENDSVSLVWFSGKGEFGKLVEKVKVNDLNDLNRLNTAIDRWLKPMGCTAFVEPLKSVKELCTDNETYSMMFLTDGCDNQWSRNNIIDASSELADLLSNAVFVEYGYYCNHSLLTDMANAMNGEVIFAEDFDRYEPIFDGICKRTVSTKRVEVEVGNPIEGFVWSCSDNGAVTYKVENGKVRIPMDVDKIYWFTDEDAVKVDDNDLKAIYQCLGVLAIARKSAFVKSLLSEIGDVALYEQYANAFGKQNLYDFAETVKKASFDSALRFVGGKQIGCRPNTDTYTVLEVIDDIKRVGGKLALDRLSYNRIGRQIEMSEDLSKAETQTLAEAIASSSSVANIKAETDKALKLASERARMKFIRNSDLVRIDGFTYNETRPNISMLCHIDGKVGLPSDAPYALPSDFYTSVFRNYTIIKDGLLNINDLPIEVDDALKALWKSKGVPMDEDGNVCVLHLRKMPLISERMVNAVSATALANDTYEWMRAKADAKVCKGFLDAIRPSEKSATLKDKYGDECAEYLKSVGITDNGFSPKTKLAAPTDKYVGTEFAVKFKGFSTIPSYNALLKKLSSGKSLTSAESLLKPKYDECESHKNDSDFADWLSAEIAKANARADALYEKIVEAKFAILVGQTWFSDLAIENPTLTSHGVAVTFEIKDTEFEI